MIHTSETNTKPRLRRREAKINNILDTALRIVYQHGLAGLTIQSLARQLDWAQGALYRYFKNKDALLAAMEARVLETFQKKLQASINQSPTKTKNHDQRSAALKRILTMGRAYMGLSHKEPHAFAPIAIMAADPTPLLPDAQAEKLIANFKALLGDVAALLDDAVQVKALENGDNMQRALSYWIAVHGLIQSQKYGRFGDALFATDALFEHFAESLLRGWGATKKDLKSAIRE